MENEYGRWYDNRRRENPRLVHKKAWEIKPVHRWATLKNAANAKSNAAHAAAAVKRVRRVEAPKTLVAQVVADGTVRVGEAVWAGARRKETKIALARGDDDRGTNDDRQLEAISLLPSVSACITLALVAGLVAAYRIFRRHRGVLHTVRSHFKIMEETAA
jgi:hypothetical protein